MALDVSSVWIGATTSTTAVVKARLVSAMSSTLLVADNEAMVGAVSLGPVAPGADNVIVWTVTGLDPGNRYWVVVDDGAPNLSYKAHFLTHPAAIGEPASYIFGAAGDAGLTGDGYDGYITSAVSNSPVFDTMRVQAAAEQWLWFSHLGDLHYKNISTNTPASFRSAYFETMNYGGFVNPAARQSQFFRSLASTYVWDDHDFGPNDSDRTSASRPAAQQVYREWVPHYPLPDGAGIFQAWQVGRVLYIASDVRSFRDPNTDPLTPAKTLLGTAQKAWMEALLGTARNSGAEALVWQSPSRWVGGSDTWSSFPYERDEMVQMFGDLGWLDRMIFMTADMHALSICTGPNNPYGRFPMFMFAGMDAGAWSTGPEYDIGSVAGRRQYGTMRVQDNGHTIALTGTGYHDGSVLMSHTAYVHVGSPVIALGYTAGHVCEPFTPTDDDQKLRNQVTVSRVDGGEYTFTKTDGPNNVNDPAADPDGVGVYDEGVQLTVASDAQLPDQAAWRVHLGSVDEARYPTLHVDLAANPGLADEMTGLYLGDRITVANPPDWLPPDTIDLIAEGGTETLAHPNGWDIELNASPGTPWLVAQLARPATLVHATFDTGLDGFTGLGGASLQRVASPGQPPSGTAWAVRITPDGVTAAGGARGPLTDAGTVTPGAEYTISCWVYSVGGWSDLRAVIDWYDAAGALLSTSPGAAVAVPAGQWTLLAATYTAPASASRLGGQARHGGTPATGNVWHTAEIVVREVRATGLAAGPDRPNRLDTSESHLVTAASSTATQFLVHTPPAGPIDRAPWIQSSGVSALFPTHFPFDLKLGGEVVRCTACTPAVLDRFTRTASSGWGTADAGGAWSTSGGAAADYDVTGTVGRHLHPSRNVFRITSLNSTALTDVDVRVSVTVPVLPTGDSLYAAVLARANITAGTFYLARLQVAPAGTVLLTLRKCLPAETVLATASYTLPHVAGQTYRIRLQVEGTAVRAKTWLAGGVEPVNWQVAATDTSLTAAGAVGLRTLVPTANTNALPVTLSFDDLEVLPQLMTVQRSINTVVKAQPAGTPLSLARPAVVAL